MQYYFPFCNFAQVEGEEWQIADECEFVARSAGEDHNQKSLQVLLTSLEFYILFFLTPPANVRTMRMQV